MPFSFVATILIALVIAPVSNAKAQIVIGVLTDLSAKSSIIGKQIELGARLGAGAPIARSGADDTLVVVEDSGCDPDTAKLAAKRLVEQNVRIVIGPICSKAMYAALDILSPAGIPLVSPFIRATHIARGRKDDGWLAYTLAGSANAEGEAIARILLKRWQGKAYAIADDGGVYGRGLADQFRTLADLSGQKPIANVNFRPLQSTQIAMLRRLARSGVEALFIGGEAYDVAQIARDAKKIGLDIEIVGGEALALLPYEDDATSIPDGILAVMPVDPALYPSSTKLVNNLKSERLQTTGGIIPGYAMVQIARAAIADDRVDLTGDAFETILGAVRFSKDGYANAYPYRLHIWANGRISPMGGF